MKRRNLLKWMVAVGCVSALPVAPALAAAPGRPLLKAPRSQVQLAGVAVSQGTGFARYRQVVDGIAVLGGEAVVAEGRGTRADALIDHTFGRLRSPAPAAVDRTAAIGAAERAVGARDLRTPPVAMLAILPRRGEAVLVWRVLLAEEDPFASSEVLVDARSGAVVGARDLVWRATGSAQIFDPNPVTKQGSRAGLADDGDADSAALTAARAPVALERISSAGCLIGPWGRARLPSGEVCVAGGNFGAVTRAGDPFEALMAYFHVSRTQAYLQGLGFTNVMNRQLLLNADAIAEDNSFYDTVTKDVTFGTGGVDDAEDADVIVHEYGHAIQDDQIPGFSNDGETGALGEGFGDYLAAAMAATFAPNHGDFDGCLAEWDAVGYTPPGLCLRRVDSGLTVAQAQGDPSCALDVHCVGQVWSSALWSIRGQLGGPDTDRIVIQSHFGLPATATFDDAARALLAADRQLYGGVHRDVLVNALTQRGLVDPERLDDTPGDATPLALPGTASGRLDAVAGDRHDVYRLALAAGGGLIVKMTAPAGEFDLRLLRPGSLTVGEGVLAGSTAAGADELFAYVPAGSGDHYLDVSATAGAGSYTIETLLDSDGDRIADAADNCPTDVNGGQEDRDRDRTGDACDGFPDDPANDADRDRRAANEDNCPATANGDQADWDRDARGDACDSSTRVELDRLRGGRRRLTATGRLLPAGLPPTAFHLIAQRQTCSRPRSCRYGQAIDLPAKTRGANGRLTVVVRRLGLGRYRVRAVIRAPGYDPARSAARAIRVR